MAREFQFYITPTPIGNMKDITIRTIEVLRNVDLIACEDTRVTRKLLNHYNITTKCISYHKYNEYERIEFLLNELHAGKKIALVSDAGTPMICDPGGVIIKELVKNGIKFTALPGACALTTFLSEIPRSSEEFAFAGFIPRGKKQIEEIMKKYAGVNLVFYDSPERILKTLEIIQSIRPQAQISLGRELSKLFEEKVSGSVSEILCRFRNGIKGEIVCMVYADINSEKYEADSKIRALKLRGFKDKEISVILSALFDLNKNEVYRQSLKISADK